MIGDDERCVALAGLLPMRLLAERAGLTAGISAAMRRPDYHPGYDRGQVLVDLGLVQLAGGQAISDFQALAHLEKLIGPVPSTPTVWRSLDEADAVQVTRIHQATCRFRRLWWAILKSRPEGFPLLSGPVRALTRITVIDLDASVVKVASDQKENAKPTYKGGVGFVPNLSTCDNVDDLLMIDPRPGNATSNDAADNIAVLTAAIAAIPGSYRRRVLVRLDGAGWSPWPPACSPRSATSACPTVTCAKPQSRACGSGFSRSPAGSPTDNARPGCTYPPTGPGPPTSPQAGRPSRPCRSRSDPVPTAPTTRSAVPRPVEPGATDATVGPHPYPPNRNP